ncbi:hypothetical protein BH10CYA1_BH10CYA1_55130 [soil metagenome]
MIGLKGVPGLRVHYLSQNSGPAMGMGLYERLLLKHVLIEQTVNSVVADLTFNGRKPKGAVELLRLPSSLQKIDFLGFSTAHLATLPWTLVKHITSLRFGPAARTSNLFHSLALSFPVTSTRPVIYTIHDLPPLLFPDEGTLPAWSKLAANEAAAIITPSEFGKLEIVKNLGVRPEGVHVVQNGCEHESFNTAVEPYIADELTAIGLPSNYLFYAGGATQRKNVLALLNAWQAICGDFTDLHLVLAGPQERLNELVSSSGAPRVVLLGYVQRDVMPRIMKSSRAVVCPSIYEGFGLPPLEAMALGVPTIGTQVGGAVPEVMADAGLLAEDGSAESLAETIRSFLLDDNLEESMKITGPKRASLFSWSDHARQVSLIYKNVLAASH